jgi:hypothetical protein
MRAVNPGQHGNDPPVQPPPAAISWEKPLIIDAMATTIAATINTKSNVERKRIAKKLRIFLIIVRVYGGHLNQF